jgi:hypothetical protein
MHITGNFLIEVAALAAIFGPLPLSFFTYHGEPYVPLGFCIGYSVAALTLGFIHIGIAFLLVPVAWYLALKPVIRKSPG